ncbi:TonB-dependent receptor [bacterium]|nr:TonB-dependent receptor [bacterium]
MKPFFSGLLPALLWAGMLSAQQTQTGADSARLAAPTIVVTATRYEKNYLETHLPVRTVTTGTLWRYGYVTTGAGIEREPGVAVIGTGPWSQQPVVRGLAGSQILSLVDGMRLEVMRSYGNHAPLIDPDMLDRIEIIRGPASILYGSDAIGGVINYITKGPPPRSNRLRVHGSAGTAFASASSLAAQSLSLSAAAPSWALRISGQHRKAGDISTPDGPLDNTGYAGSTFQTSVHIFPAVRHRLALSTSLQRFRDVGIPVNAYASSAAFSRYDRTLGSCIWTFTNPGKPLAGATLTGYLQQGYRAFTARIEGVPKGTRFAEQDLSAVRHVRTGGASLLTTLHIAPAHLVTAGIEGYVTGDRSSRTSDAAMRDASGAIVADPPADTTPPNPRGRRSGYGIFITDEFVASGRFSLLLGLRYDINRTYARGTEGTLTPENRHETDHDWSGNAGILWRLTPSLRLTGNIGRAFSSPTLMQRYFSGTAQVGYLEGNPSLGSEKSVNVDAGLKWNTGLFSGEVSIFRNRIHNYIAMAPVSAAADSFIYANIGEAALTGGELRTTLLIGRRLSCGVTASFVRGEDLELSAPLPKIPPLGGRITLGYTFPGETVSLETTAALVSAQRRTDRYESSTPGYHTFDLNAVIDVSSLLALPRSVSLTVTVTNLTNERYRDHLSTVTWWPAPGRDIRIGLKGMF